jgi:CheY-like chemotaxis protein
VDDSPSARRLFQNLLIRLGVSLPELRLASGASDAMQMFTQWRPNLVFVDIDLRAMPVVPPPAGTAPPEGGHRSVDGDELARQMLERDPRLKLVVVTAYDAENPRVKKLRELGANDVIVKPVLAARVQEILQRLSPPPGRSPPRRR